MSGILIKWVWVESVCTLWAVAPTRHVWHMLKSRMTVAVESVVFLLVYNNLPSTKTNHHPKWALVKKVTHTLCVSTFSQWIQHIPTGVHPTNTTWGRAFLRTSIPCLQFNVWLFWGLHWLFLFSVSLVSQKLICPLYRIAHLK